MKASSLVVFALACALILAACGRVTLPVPTPGTDGEGEQAPITLDAEFLAIAETVPEFAGLYYDEQGVLQVAMAAPDSVGLRALENRRDSVADSLTAVLGEDILNRQPSLAQQQEIDRVFTAGDGASLHTLAVPEQGFTLVPVRYSFRDLAGWREQAGSVVWGIEGVTMLDIDEFANHLYVSVDDRSAIGRVRSELARLNLPNDAFEIAVEEPDVPLATLTDRVRPVVGGLRITRGTMGCTLGFNVIRNGTSGFLTNSHCTSDQTRVRGNRFNQGGAWVGTEAAEAAITTTSVPGTTIRSRWADVAFVRYRSDTNPRRRLGGIAYVNFGTRTVTSTTLISYRSYNPIVGETIHKVGSRTGRTSGRISRTCTDVRSSTSGIINRCQTRVKATNSTTISRGGDSGSPVFMFRYVRNVGWKVELKGILWGGSGSGSDSQFVFSPTRNIERALGGMRVHPRQQTGERLRVTLRWVRVHEDCDDGSNKGEVYGYFNIEGRRVFTLSETKVASGDRIDIYRSLDVAARYDNLINISGRLRDEDPWNPDDDIGRWNINLQPVPSTGYYSNYSNPDCSATLHYEIRDVGNLYE